LEIGLDPGCSFTKYSKVDKDVLAWVVVGSRRDSFMLHTWWFPIVGRVPYKGFFSQDDARDEAASLEKEGYECWVRGTEAFSTLGWFSDPVLSTTLKHSHARIANTVIHESVHSTVWIKNNVTFNESLANFVGTEGAAAFFARRAAQCAESDCTTARSDAAEAQNDLTFQYELSALVDAMYLALDSLYKDEAFGQDEKIARRASVFEEYMVPFRAKFPSLQILKAVNNAEIIQLKLYLSSLVTFRKVFDANGRDWGRFTDRMRAIKDAVDENSSLDPFVLLRQSLEPIGSGDSPENK
jgi:predicted aminopeptidase